MNLYPEVAVKPDFTLQGTQEWHNQKKKYDDAIQRRNVALCLEKDRLQDRLQKEEISRFHQEHPWLSLKECRKEVRNLVFVSRDNRRAAEAARAAAAAEIPAEEAAAAIPAGEASLTGGFLPPANISRGGLLVPIPMVLVMPPTILPIRLPPVNPLVGVVGVAGVMGWRIWRYFFETE